MGANRALIGQELVQFAEATALGNRRWRLRGLLRGRGGTEWAIDGHAPGEAFVAIDDSLVALDAAVLGDPGFVQVAALGLADTEPVRSPILSPRSSLLPLSPVHERSVLRADGGLVLTWVRRARGAWSWPDGVDAPLVEQAEAYIVALGDPGAPVAQWEVSAPLLTIDPVVMLDLQDAAPGAALTVRQRGDHGLSRPLDLGPLP